MPRALLNLKVYLLIEKKWVALDRPAGSVRTGHMYTVMTRFSTLY